MVVSKTVFNGKDGDCTMTLEEVAAWERDMVPSITVVDAIRATLPAGWTAIPAGLVPAIAETLGCSQGSLHQRLMKQGYSTLTARDTAVLAVYALRTAKEPSRLLARLRAEIGGWA